MTPLMPRVLHVFQVPGLHLPADIPAVRKLPLVPKAHQHREGKRSHTGLSGNLPEDWGLREPESRRMRAGRLLETAYSSIFLLGSFAVACFIFFFQKLNSLQCFMLYPLRGTSLSNYSSRIPKLN